MAVLEIAKIQVRRGQENITGVPRLDPGEFGWAQDTENLYIGKRIAEGAVDDENTRILTQNDLNNIFSLLNIENTLTLTAVYQYRTNVEYIASDTVPRLVQQKLDEQNPSLEDFNVLPSITPVDITAEFQNAVETLYFNGAWDSEQRKDSRRTLKIPPGVFLISGAISLPPYARIEGAGPELTILRLVSDATNIFRTVDADGNDFSTNDMRSGVKRSREVHIEGITLEYEPTNNSNNALISLDNVLDATIKNCILRTQITDDSTTTYGIVSDGVGIEIRGTGGGLGSGDTNLCENVIIDNCKFDSLYIAIRSTGTVIRPVITNSVFSNLNRGVEMYTIDQSPGPSNGILTKNRFENIVREGVFVGPNPENYRTEHILDHNYFVQVGNGTNLDDFVTTSTDITPVISFLSPGNKSIDNFFHRKYVADTTTSTEFYYAPLITGKLTIIDSATTTGTIYANSSTVLVKLPLTGEDQMISINYQLYNSTLSRKGTALINITPDGFPAVTDTYNYIEYVDEFAESEPLDFRIEPTFLSKNYVVLYCDNQRFDDLTIEYQFNTMR